MNESEYIDQFHDLLIESIENLINRKEKIGMAFSGGLDSTVLARMLLKSG